ncbi:MAG: FAS1-like dehydratase domain-containing protein [Promethearchaeota archaeon]
MSEMTKEEMLKNAEFLIKTLPGTELPGEARIKVRARTMRALAECFGITDPKYVGENDDEIIACKAFANAFTVKSFYTLIPSAKLTLPDGTQRDFLLNPNKLLHAGNKYNWEGCVPVKAGDKLTGKGKWVDVWLVEKNMILFASLELEVRNQNNELVCKVLTRAAVRPGGY